MNVFYCYMSSDLMGYTLKFGGFFFYCFRGVATSFCRKAEQLAMVLQ